MNLKIARENNNRDVREIMITTGGSDPFNLTLRLANAILPEEEFKDVRINIVVGSGFTNADKLRELSERNPNVVLHEMFCECRK